MVNAGRGAAAGLCPDRRIAEAAFLAAALGTMASLHLVLFGMPTLNPDESSLIIMGLTLFSEPGSAWYDYGLLQGSRIGPFPFQFSPYIGALGAYTSLPFSYALGPSVEAVRAYNMFVVLVLQLALYAATRELFSRTPAMIATAAFSAFPFVIFFSRQSSMYDWIILPITLFILWAGVRFVRGGSFWHLAAAVLSCWLIIWAYLYSVWPVLGMLAALPFCIMAFKKRRPVRALRKDVLCAIVLGVTGFVPFIAQYATNPEGSLIQLLLDVVYEDTMYLHHSTDNSAVLTNLHIRLAQMYDLLAKPETAFVFAKNWYGDWNPFNPTFVVLLGASTVVAGFEIYKRRLGWGTFAGLSVVVFTIIVSSTFTVSVLNTATLGIMLPFVFVLIGGGLGRATTMLARMRWLKKSRLSQVHLAAFIVGITVASQIPYVYGGFAYMHGDPANMYMHAADGLRTYLNDNNADPVSMGWYTHKSLFMVLGGDLVPSHIHGPWNLPEFNSDVRKMLDTAEIQVGENTAFVLYMYPEEIDCSNDLEAFDIPRSNQCAQTYFVESLADRMDLGANVTDFDLPDGKPYYRVLHLVS